MKSSKKTTYAKVYLTAFELFGFDKNKTNSWWMSPCEEFNNLSPFEMVREGKGRQLLKLMHKCL